MTFDLTFGILQRGLDDFVLLSEDELAEGVRLALRSTHNLAEGAGGAAIAAAMKCQRPASPGSAWSCVMSGGNLDPARLAANPDIATGPRRDDRATRATVPPDCAMCNRDRHRAAPAAGRAQSRL